MFRTIGLVLSVAAAATTLAGCGAPLVHSAAAGGERVIDAGLAGTWVCADPALRAEIVSAGGPDAGYSATVAAIENGQVKTKVVLEMGLMEVGGMRCADLFLSRADRDRLVGSYGFLAVPVHQLVRLDRDGDRLAVRCFRAEFVEGLSDAKAYPHERVTVGGGSLVMMTAPSATLRELVMRHGKSPGAWSDPVIFTRAKK